MIDLLASSPALWTGLAALLGLMIGSFLNVVAHRLPIMLEREWREQCAEMQSSTAAALPPYNLLVPRSACPACNHAIPWFENIPVLSWLFLRGRCSACGARIAVRYPLIEATCGVLTAYAAWHFGFTVQAIAAWLLLWSLLALTAIDLDTHLLPDSITLPLLWAGLLVNLGGHFAPLESAVIGAMAGYLVLWLVYHAFRLLTGKEGMGFGDFKLLAALGAWFGWMMLPLIILLSSLIGALLGIAMIGLAGRDRSRPIPFGPFLAIAGVVALFWGQAIVGAYLGQ